MESLARAVVIAIGHIASAPSDDDRADADVQALEEVFSVLRSASSTEKDAILAATKIEIERAEVQPVWRDEYLTNLRCIPENLKE